MYKMDRRNWTDYYKYDSSARINSDFITWESVLFQHVFQQKQNLQITSTVGEFGDEKVFLLGLMIRVRTLIWNSF